MRDYAKIAPQFWIGKTGKKLRSKGMEAQIVAMYLISSPHSNMIGMYYCPIMFIAHETGLTIEGASKGLRSASEAGFCSYDDDSEIVFVYEMAKYQIGDRLDPNDKRCKGIQNEYDSMPQTRFLAEFFDRYAECFNLSNKRENASPFEAPSKPLRSQEQEQEQEQEQKKSAPSLRDAPLPSPAKQKSITFSTWLHEVKQKGEKAVSEYQPVWDYAETTGIPADWIEIAWLKFRERFETDEKASRKRYTDWRRVFLRAVKENWLNLWFFDRKQEAFCLTTVGVCADITTREPKE